MIDRSHDFRSHKGVVFTEARGVGEKEPWLPLSKPYDNVSGPSAAFFQGDWDEAYILSMHHSDAVMQIPRTGRLR